ncbi:penicillin-binding transpeptidase domain-containing protein [Corynebacterium terpenotabidum]|uniref:Penicillin-binding protein n=1 Tax=Corynebacterium terpenotabidum Y-11 TaxID=1200352 RepID=S4XDV3_9CORY|nr:penicillin-binding transpeptidase domain-containing protein [Corynebacterium terpenotabidum]AGP30731.1 penicillin-binding protein [Corynebacterium terpenotabidum Y-11]
MRAPISAVPLATVLAASLVVSGCSMPWSDSPTDEFLAAVNSGNWEDAASATTDPATAQTWLEAMDDSTGDTTLHLDNADGTTTATWTVPAGDAVTSDGTLTTGDDDKVTWDPTIFSADLTDGAGLAYSDDRNYGLQILDRNNTVQLTWTPVTVVTADAGADLTALADAVRPAVPEFSAEDAAAQIAEAGGPVALLTLREEDADQVRDALTALSGVTIREDGKLLAESESSSAVDGGLTDYWTQTLDDTAGWTLAVTGADGTPGTVLGSQAPESLDAVHTTMDLGVQAAANRAVDSSELPASIVALSVSTGGVLAAAQNSAADAEGTPALTGLFPPGSTFKTVTTSAALARGTVGADDIVDCPASVEVDGRTIPNDDDFSLGQVPLHTAFAQSCNTTQALISSDLEPDDLKNTAAQYGLGVDFTAPGMTTVTGSVPVTDRGAARVESAIGQGEVVASPFGLALMEASIAKGSMAIPSLIQGETTQADQAPAAMDPAVLTALRSMMRETVESGTASALSDIADLGGKTGTAEVDGQPAHGWFVGVVGDVAFCTFIAGADSSSPAVEMSGNFLRDEAMTDLVAQ